MKHWLLLGLLALAGLHAQAQKAAVKTNLLGDARTNVSLGAEMGLAKRWTLDMDGSFNGWTFSEGKRWKHWMLRPEARYWFCDRWNGHFLGVHTFGGQYNMGGIKGLHDFLGTEFSKFASHRYQGWFVGAGVAYGYDWILSRHWNLEATVGFGWAYTRFDEFNCVGCGRKTDSDHPHNYIGPTRAAINLVYLF